MHKIFFYSVEILVYNIVMDVGNIFNQYVKNNVTT